MRCSDQDAHIWERLTANRFDLTLQGGPNQHGTQKPRWTPRTNFSPSLSRTTEPPHFHIVSRALRETTKSKLMHPNSPRPLDYPKGWEGVLYFQKEAVLGLSVSTTSYSRYAVSTIQTRSAGPDIERSLTDTDGAKQFPPDLQFHFLSFLKSAAYILRYKNILYLASNRKLLDFYRVLFSMPCLSSYIQGWAFG